VLGLELPQIEMAEVTRAAEIAPLLAPKARFENKLQRGGPIGLPSIRQSRNRLLRIQFLVYSRSSNHLQPKYTRVILTCARIMHVIFLAGYPRERQKSTFNSTFDSTCLWSFVGMLAPPQASTFWKLALLELINGVREIPPVLHPHPACRFR